MIQNRMVDAVAHLTCCLNQYNTERKNAFNSGPIATQSAIETSNTYGVKKLCGLRVRRS